MARRKLPSGTTALLVGTKRGLFMFSSPDRRRWRSHGAILESGQIYNGILDQRSGTPRIYAADNHFIFGPRIRYSDSYGNSWKEPRVPIKFPESSGMSLANVWIVQ